MPLEYTPDTQSALCLIFLTYVAAILCLNYGGQEKNAVFDSDTTVTLKRDQSCQNWYELVDPSEVLNIQV